MDKQTIFISYSHKNEIWKDLVQKQLKVPNSGAHIEVWSDRNIKGGDDWEEKILDAIESAKVALLLITADFLTSDFILKKEVPLILERREKKEIIVVPIICEPVAFEEVAWLKPIQARPKDGKPISKGDKSKRNSDIADIAREIRKLLFPPSKEKKRPTITVGKPQSIKFKPTKINRELLPYLVDRTKQEDELGEKLQEYSFTTSCPVLVTFIHGDEFESHPQFVRRLQYYSLPNLLRASEAQACPRFLSFDWPDSFDDSQDLERKILLKLIKYAGKLTPREYKQVPNEINKSHAGPIILHSQILADDMQSNYKLMISGFLDFWCEWPKRSKGILMACLVIKYRRGKKRGFWGRFRSYSSSYESINQTIRKILKELDFKAHPDSKGFVFPELKGIRRNDAEQWTTLKEVEQVCGKRDLTPEIREIYECPDIEKDENRIPMEYLAKELNKRIIYKCRNLGEE